MHNSPGHVIRGQGRRRRAGAGWGEGEGVVAHGEQANAGKKGGLPWSHLASAHMAILAILAILASGGVRRGEGAPVGALVGAGGGAGSA